MLAQNKVASDNHSASQGRVGDTELHWAAYRGHAGVVERLLRDGAQVDQRVDKGSTPLHLAAYRGHEAVVALLIEYGATVNARNEEGITPLDWARSNSQSDVEAFLLANGAVVGKPLPVKSLSKRDGGAASEEANPGQYLLSNSGQYRAPPVQKNRPKARVQKERAQKRVQNEVLERPIQQNELDRLESVSQINQIMEKYRNEQSPEIAGTVEPANTEEVGLAAHEDKSPENKLPENSPPEKASPSQAFRVQLAAVSDYDRAETLRAEYAKRYRDILDEDTLVVEPVNTAARKLYRLRSSALSQSKAAFVCEQLKRSNQDCIIVAPLGL